VDAIAACSIALGGLQEALIAARVGATNPTATAQGGKVRCRKPRSRRALVSPRNL